MKQTERKPLDEKWKSYAAKVLRGIPADSVQYQETQRAFYAGASVIMGAVKATGEPDVSEQSAVWLLETLEAELLEFMNAVIAKAKRIRESN